MSKKRKINALMYLWFVLSGALVALIYLMIPVRSITPYAVGVILLNLVIHKMVSDYNVQEA